MFCCDLYKEIMVALVFIYIVTIFLFLLGAKFLFVM